MEYEEKKSFFCLTRVLQPLPSNHLLGLFSVPAPLFSLLAGSSAGFFCALACLANRR
jgi:hypothetical protein